MGLHPPLQHAVASRLATVVGHRFPWVCTHGYNVPSRCDSKSVRSARCNSKKARRTHSPGFWFSNCSKVLRLRLRIAYLSSAGSALPLTSVFISEPVSDLRSKSPAVTMIILSGVTNFLIAPSTCSLVTDWIASSLS